MQWYLSQYKSVLWLIMVIMVVYPRAYPQTVVHVVYTGHILVVFGCLSHLLASVVLKMKWQTEKFTSEQNVNESFTTVY